MERLFKPSAAASASSRVACRGLSIVRDFGPSRRAQDLQPPIWHSSQLLTKLEVFEAHLVEEQISGPMKDSVLMLALASIKQDVVDLLEGVK
jgi:hypothetical protein